MVKIPNKITPLLAEEIGAHIGDGSMGIYNGTHIVSFSGHPIDDKYYYKWLAWCYLKLFGIKVNLRCWSGAYGFQAISRDLVKFKCYIGLPLGPKININIPPVIQESENRKIISASIRGIFDTDGTLYFENRKSCLYPRIQLKVSSKPLTKTVKEILIKRFNLRATSYNNVEKGRRYYFVEIRGKENLMKWIKLIGFRNLKHMSKFMLWKNGINPRKPIEDRLKILTNYLSPTEAFI
jgi:intein/homing endonuclease